MSSTSSSDTPKLPLSPRKQGATLVAPAPAGRNIRNVISSSIVNPASRFVQENPQVLAATLRYTLLEGRDTLESP